MDQRIVWEDQTRTSEFGDEHAFVIDDVKVFGVVRESCAFDVTGKIDGHEMGEEGIGKAAPTNVPPTERAIVSTDRVLARPGTLSNRQ